MFVIINWVEKKNKKIKNHPGSANYILETVWSLWVKWGSACRRVSHTTGARLWQANVMTEGGHGPLTNPRDREPWRRTSFVPLTVDHYIIFPAGFTAVLLTDPPPPQAQTSTLSPLTPTTGGGLVSTSPSKLPLANLLFHPILVVAEAYCEPFKRKSTLKLLALIYNCEIN